MIPVPVWDLATRLFHWLLVTFVLVCFVTGEDEGLIFAVHAYAGFVVLVLIVFRLAWGVVGSQHSRFTDFVHGWSVVRRHAVSLLRLRPERFVGHNPLGGWMIVAMLAVLSLAALSGLAMVAGGWQWLDDLHEALGSIMQLLVGIHIVGVLVDQFLVGEKIIQAMVWGDKPLEEGQAAAEPKLASPLLTLAVAVLVLAGGAYLFTLVDYGARVAAYAADNESRGDGRD